MNVSTLLRSFLRFIKWKLYIKQHYAADRWYFVSDYGIGDLYLLSSLLPKLVSQGKKVSVIIDKENRSFIPSLFSEEVEIVFDPAIQRNLIKEFGQYRVGNPILLHPIDLLGSGLLQVIGFNKMTLIDSYKILLNLPIKTIPSSPLFKLEYIDEITRIFLDNELVKGKTVLLCPQANSISILSESIWLKLAFFLKETGFIPVFLNVRIEAFPMVEFPLFYSKEFCDYAGHIISLRSGFCDLIASSSAKKIILYPDELWQSGSMIDGAGLVAMNLCDNADILELVLNAYNIENLNKQVSSFFAPEYVG